MTEPNGDRPGIRLWPLYIIAGLAFIALLWIWIPESHHHQGQTQGTLATFILIAFFGLLWLLFLSRLAWRWRLRYFVRAVFIIALLVGSFRIKGFSGDFMPILVWRFSGEAAATRVEGGGVTPMAARDWPQLLGPDRDNQLRGVRLARDWQEQPPREVWRRPVGPAWSSFATVGGRAVTQEQHGPEEQIVCYDLASGRKLWSHADTARYESGMGGVGPRATPTIADGRVYSVGATGRLNVLDLESGAVIWSRDIVADNAAEVPMFGISGSPLVLSDKVVVSPGGPGGRSLVAYDRDNGAFIWGGGGDKAGYSSPRLVSLAGRDQILIFNEHSYHITAHHPETGAVLWRRVWDHGFVQAVANPLVLPGDRVLASTGYGAGAELYQISADDDGSLSGELLWRNRNLKAKFANMAYRDGFVYGLDDGILVCLDPETGKRRWKRGRYGHGQMILVDDLLLITSEEGAVVLVEATPEKHNELARIEVFDDKTWNPPALAAPYLLVRTDSEAVCLEVPLQEGLARR